MPIPGENPELDAETAVPLLVAISVVFVAISSIAVLLRLVTRYVIIKNVGLDDITVTIALVLSSGVSATTVIQAKYKLGRHVWMTTEEEQIKQVKTLFAAMMIYNPALFVIKASFLLQYRRIFAQERMQKICFWLLLSLAAWGITQEILVGFGCTPLATFTPSMQSVCIKSAIAWYLTSLMNIVTDFIVFMVPMLAIKSLQLPRKQKILLAGIFGLGFFTCVVSIYRLLVLHKAFDTEDPTWDNVAPATWSVVEVNTAILCACLPTLRPLLRKAMPSSSSRRSRDYRGFANSGHGSATKPRAYILRHVERSSSQEGFNEEGQAAIYYESDEFARHDGNISMVSTAIYGKKVAATPDKNESRSLSSPGRSQHIMVTREIAVRETIQGKSGGGTQQDAKMWLRR